MTRDAERARLAARDAAIVARYADGHSVAAIGREYGVGKQRVVQVLKRAGVWVSQRRSGRTKFLGVSISEATKDQLVKLAGERGLSVSKLTSDALDELVAPAAGEVKP